MQYIPFELVTPDKIMPGDIIMCYRHDDQWEARSARVERIEISSIPDTWTFTVGGKTYGYFYEYRVWLYCRHVNLKKLDAAGGSMYVWHRFPWNNVARYVFEEQMNG